MVPASPMCHEEHGFRVSNFTLEENPKDDDPYSEGQGGEAGRRLLVYTQQRDWPNLNLKSLGEILVPIRLPSVLNKPIRSPTSGCPRGQSLAPRVQGSHAGWHCALTAPIWP